MLCGVGSDQEPYLGQCQPPQAKGHFISIVSCLTLCALFHASSFIQQHCVGIDVLGKKGKKKKKKENMLYICKYTLYKEDSRKTMLN